MDILPSLSTLLVSSCAGISKEACAALSRVLAAAGRDVKVELDDMVLSYALPTDSQS